jgi:hypothetical protein
VSRMASRDATVTNRTETSPATSAITPATTSPNAVTRVHSVDRSAADRDAAGRDAADRSAADRSAAGWDAADRDASLIRSGRPFHPLRAGHRNAPWASHLRHPRSGTQVGQGRPSRLLSSMAQEARPLIALARRHINVLFAPPHTRTPQPPNHTRETASAARQAHEEGSPPARSGRNALRHMAFPRRVRGVGTLCGLHAHVGVRCRPAVWVGRCAGSAHDASPPVRPGRNALRPRAFLAGWVASEPSVGLAPSVPAWG